MSDARTFTCRECGSFVWDFCHEAADDKRCMVCTFIHSIPDPKSRADARARLYEAPQMRYWAAFGCYADDDYEERRCEACGKLYRGPSVYCSHACTMADA